MTVKLCFVIEIHGETQIEKMLKTREVSTELGKISESNFTLWGKKKF